MSLRSYLRKLRYLRHPYLITRTILRPFEELESQKHLLRLSEYERYSTSIEDGVEILTGITKSDETRLMKELEDSEFLQHIELHMKQIEGIGGSVGFKLGRFLYELVRALHPKIVVETGVANGISSSFILKALSENCSGRLYSVDLHYREGVVVPPGRRLGWVIPQGLRDRWSLVLGESAKVLPRLLNDLGCIDLFLHDSRHLYRTMMKEYSIVWPYLREEGLLLSDDVIENDAFIDFADEVKLCPVVVGRMGAIRKITLNVDNV